MSELKKIFQLLVITLLSAHVVMAEGLSVNNYPTYENGMLTIPRVDTLEQAGTFQNGVFQFDGQIGAWRLLDFRTSVINGDATVEIINTVEEIITDSFPVQVFLKINGDFTSGCFELGQVNQRLNDSKFEVIIHANPTNIPPDQITCTQGLVPFETTIPLSVYGLSAGTYEYSVNGGEIGTFTLTEDNKL